MPVPPDRAGKTGLIEERSSEFKSSFYGCKMEQLSIYLFESKSIQAYLCRTGKLRHMINASDRLDALIGPEKDGLIYQSLQAAGLDPEKDSNLLASQKGGYEVAEDNGRIVFFRYLGGSLSCYALGERGYENLLRFRCALTLSAHASLPGLQFSDAFASREISDNAGFYSLLGDAYKQLAADNNRPSMLLPLATACAASAPATGEAAVRSRGKGGMKADRDGQDRVMESLKANYKDIKLSLYLKYLTRRGKTDEAMRNLAGQLNDIFARYANLTESDDALEPEGDIALIHMDGNSVGATLIKLRDRLKTDSVSRPEYVKVMLEISAILGDSTRNAVVTAVTGLLKKDSCLKFRPLVLGGDDVTLLIQPEHAPDFCVDFARAFREETEKNLRGSPLIRKYLKGKKTGKPVLDYLTSSGGILFQKKKHPYATSVRLAEGLAEIAKNRFPVPADSDDEVIPVNPSAVAFVRLTESSGESIKSILERLRSFPQSSGGIFHTGVRNGFITCNNSGEAVDEITLEGLVSAVRKQNGGPVITRFRRMLSEISRGRRTDADHLYSQAETMDSSFMSNTLVDLLMKNTIRRDGDAANRWCYRTEDGMETVINDILVLDHYINGDDSGDGGDEPGGAEAEKEA